jgi:hypothetical protein
LEFKSLLHSSLCNNYRSIDNARLRHNINLGWCAGGATGKEAESSELCPPYPADTPCMGGFASITNVDKSIWSKLKWFRYAYIDCIE